MDLNEKIEIVKNDILKRFPNCGHTVKILLWDDGTDLVECRHGDGKKLYVSTYYNNELSYREDRIYSNKVCLDETGKEFCVLTEEEYKEYSGLK